MNPDTAAPDHRQSHPVREWIRTIVIALAIALPIRFFIAEPFIVSGASMDPTFTSGQFLVVDRVTYRFGNPNRGDILIFKYPHNPRVYYIKRVIGLPGETIDITQGRITITNPAHPSGFELDEPYLNPSHLSHDNVSASLGPNEYFVIGDNRTQSSDSRVWGPLDARYIIGRPIVRLLPIHKISFIPGEHDYEETVTR